MVVGKSMRLALAKWLWLMTLMVSGAGFAAAIEDGVKPPLLAFKIDAQVVRCDAGPVGDTKALTSMLQQGASVRMTWSFSIARKRQYWLNATVGELLVARVVTSDLISRRWHLQDTITGMDVVTGDIERAIRFLTELHDFPLIDRSLLSPQEDYRVRLTLHVDDSEQAPAWWQRWLELNNQVLTGDFSLPSP
ncbi:MAG: DUF4390 domain-containing protein [Mariprofundales bacterium]